MYGDLKQLVNLKYGREAERLSREYSERLRVEQAAAAARGGSGSAQIKLRLAANVSERTIRALADLWLDAIIRRDRVLSRQAVTFIIREISQVAAARKAGAAQFLGSDRSAHAQQELSRRLESVVADVRRDLAIKLQEQKLLAPAQPAAGQSAPAVPKKMDSLLPLFDRSGFDSDLTSLTSNASEDAPVALIFMDIDDFKSINDGPGGHTAGDNALASVAQVVLQVSKGKGSAYRFGGDEFCVILPNFSCDESREVAERIRCGVAAIHLEGLPQNLSCSMGVASYPKPIADATALLNAADKAMYASKNAGGNRVSTTQVEAAESKDKSARPRVSSEQLQDRIAAVDLELSIDQGTRYFLVYVENKSDEDVRVKKIKLCHQGVKVTEAPAQPSTPDEWDVVPRGRRPIGWTATNDPCVALMGLLGVFDRAAPAILEVFLQAEVLGRLKTFDTQRIKVQTDPGVRRIVQIR